MTDPSGTAPGQLSGAELIMLDQLIRRIDNYLGNGGFFNPESIEHEKVRELLLDTRKALVTLRQGAEARTVRYCTTCQGRGWIMKSEHRDLGNGLGAGGAWNEPCPDCTKAASAPPPETGCLPVDAAFRRIRAEVLRAERKHAPMHSAHEGYSVILEEVDELWEEVRKQTHARQPIQMETECVQIAAMAIRFILNVVWNTRAEQPDPPVRVPPQTEGAPSDIFNKDYRKAAPAQTGEPT